MKKNIVVINKLRKELKEHKENKADYEVILEKSQELDKYIFDELLNINNKDNKG